VIKRVNSNLVKIRVWSSRNFSRKETHHRWWWGSQAEPGCSQTMVPTLRFHPANKSRIWDGDYKRNPNFKSSKGWRVSPSSSTCVARCLWMLAFCSVFYFTEQNRLHNCTWCTL